MQTNHKISYIFIILITLGFIGGGWYFYQHLFQGISEPIRLVPDDAALIVEIPDFSTFYNKWNHEGTYAKALKEMPFTKDLSAWVPDFLQLLQKNSTDFADWSSPKLMISVHPQGALVLFADGEIGLQDLQSEVLSLLAIHPKIDERTKASEYYLDVDFKNHHLFFSEKRGVFMVSNSLDILQKAIKNAKSSNNIAQSEEYLSLQKVSGKRADAHVYINYKYVGSSLSSQLSNLSTPVWTHQAQLANWSGLDVNLKSDELLLNGYTLQNDSVPELVDLFKRQQEMGMLLPDNFPYNTLSFQHISISDYVSFYQSWEGYLKATKSWDEHKKDFVKIQRALKKTTYEMEKSWWAGEMAQLKTEDGKEYALFLATKGRDSFRALSQVAHLSQPDIISLDYKGVKMKEINFPYYLYTQFGPWFSSFKKTYFAVVDELVIFSHNISDLKAYIDLLEEGQILQKNEAYNDFSDNLSKNANYSFYIKQPALLNSVLRYLPKDIKKKIGATSLFKKDLSSFSLQLNWKNKMLYTGIFAGLSGKKPKTNSQWQVYLDSPIVAGPFVVSDHTDGSKKYLAFDEFKQVYLINRQGDVVWKRQLDESPISQVFEVDYYANGKIQYLFNSENYIYLMDLTGEMVKGYPVTLNSSATAGLSVFDYNSDKNYRILIPASNGEIYNYKLDASLLKGWKAKNTRRKIVKPISHVVANSKDYLIAEAGNGNVLMLSRKGEVRLEIRKSFVNALGSDIYANRTNSKGMMVTTDQDGKFVYIPEKGGVKTSDFGSYSKDHYFLYADFSGNGSEDFIFVDGQKLQIFDRFKHDILSYEFEHPIHEKPRLFTVLGRKVLGVVDENAALLYLFNYDGLMGKAIACDKFYTITTAVSGSPVVLIGRGKSLTKYSLHQ